MRIMQEVFLDKLLDRVSYWTDDQDILELYRLYYCNMVYNGCFDGTERDVMSIVDNDYVNWHDVVSDEDLNNYFDDDVDLEERIEARYNGFNLVYVG